MKERKEAKMKRKRQSSYLCKDTCLVLERSQTCLIYGIPKYNLSIMEINTW